jgi:hypothetical protein
MRPRFGKRKFLFFIPIFFLAVILFGGAVMLLWNNILVAVLNVHMINFWQALGILVLSKILFGGFRGAHWGRHQWKQGMMQRWEGMSPEEKEKFKQEWENRCGRRFGRPFQEEKAEK